MELLNFYKVMIAVHKKYKMLRSGSLKFLWNDYQGLCYARFSHTEQMIIVLNNRDEGRDVMIEVWAGRNQQTGRNSIYKAGAIFSGRVYRPPETDSVPGWIAESVSATVQCDSTAS